MPTPLSDDQKSQLADLYDEAQRTGDTASMTRIRSALANDRSMQQNGPLNGMSTSDRFFAGFGKQLADWGRGLQQLVTPSSAYDPETDSSVDNSQQVNQQNADIAESRRLDQPLSKDTAGRVGGMAAQAAPFFLGGAGLPAAAAIGAGEGALTPTVGDESRLQNTAIGAAAGAAGNVAGRVAGAIIRPVGNYLVGARDAAVQVLKDAGIPLDAFQQTGSKLLMTARNAAADNPVLGASTMPRQQSEAFTRAALKEVGVDGTEADQSTMDSAMRTIKNNYNQLAARTTINYDPVMDRALYTLKSQAGEALNEADAKVINQQIKNINDAVRTGPDPGSGRIDGERAQALLEGLDRVAPEGGKSPFVEDIRNVLLDAIRRSATPADQRLMQVTDQQYGAWKQIARSIGDDNQVSPSLLFNTMDAAAREGQSVRGLGPNQNLYQLAQAGKLLLGKGMQTPNSGTAQRAAGIALFGSAGAAADSHYRGGGGMEPWLAGLATGIGGPALVRAAIENPAVANGLRKWATSQGIKKASDVARYLTSRPASGYATSQATTPSPAGGTQ